MSTLPLRRRVLHRACWVGAALCALVVFRQRSTGHRALPQDGPYLLLGNHTSALDPLWAAFPIWRPAHFMASAALFRIRGLGAVISALGAFPKQKGVRDSTSMKTLLRLYKDGQVVVMFPEGTRTWDGRQVPVRDGVGRLIRKLKARVVFVRNRTGYLFQPRWARYPRWVPVELEYSAPFTFEGMSADAIAEVVEAQLQVDPEARAQGTAFGFRMAHGLPEYLWACPSCFARGGLQLDPRDGNRVRCGACGRGWTVTVDARLVDDAGVEDTVAAHHDRVVAHFGAPPVADAADRAATGVVLRGARGAVSEVARGGAVTLLAAGELRLTPERLSVHGPEGEALWSVDLAPLRAVSVEIGNSLRLLPPDTQVVVEPGGDSPLMWAHFLSWWAHRAKHGADAGAPPPV
ncbi:MAG: 1-acyl-sn-glycerol-3-phosphate acyltransferase [Alphaproteobacteria bacterium]|nr:1-acyl-sn-glycerol-3-phosphate acyltransferase [Alphaproteobacteria bacterium]